MNKPKATTKAATTAVAVVTGSLLLVGLLGGCAQDDVSFRSIRFNLSPELASTADRPDDIERHLAVMSDLNMRSFWDDVQRVWYVDHPSRLSPYPIISTSGNPR